MLRSAIGLVFAGWLTAASAQPPATQAQPSVTPRATVTLLSEVASVAPGQPFRVALDQALARGWHTYWTNPGDAGAPPELRFELAEGARAGALQFPAPQRIPYGPLVNFGYLNSATFLAEVTPPATLRPGDSFTIAAQASWLVCENVCIPEEARFEITLPVEAAARPAPGMAARFDAAEASQPRPTPFAARLGFEGGQGALMLTGDGLAPGAVREAFFFPAADTVLDHAAPQPLSLGQGTLRLGLTRPQGPLPTLIEGVVSITDSQGMSSAYTVSAVPGAVPAAAAGMALWQALLFAGLGGLILNLMPCVFPILAMKAMAVARLTGAGRGTIRAHAASYTAGVVLSFMAIGGALLALRLAGSAAGWGFQFTQPVLVAAMAWLVLLVGLNLSGVFAVGGPVSAGGSLAARGGHAGSFFTGALAVLVATPCTAPFMAAALGAAVLMPPADMLAVFAAMGLGMALPYALLALAPGLARLLPRPGAWMDRLKQALAFPMYAAAAWLVWVVAQLAGHDGLGYALFGGVLVAFAAWAYGQGPRWGRGTAIAAMVGALALLPPLAAAPPPATVAGAREAWSAPRLAALREGGRPVFVNLTAAWCISCKVNERVALDTTAVRAAFARAQVTTLVGDWTRGDPAITALLRENAREGVPLYLLYPAGGGAPVVLPQILTEGIVLRAIAEASTS